MSAAFHVNLRAAMADRIERRDKGVVTKFSAETGSAQVLCNKDGERKHWAGREDFGKLRPSLLQGEWGGVSTRSCDVLVCVFLCRSLFLLAWKPK